VEGKNVEKFCCICLELEPGSTEKYFESNVRKSPFCLILDPGYGTESSEK
jgi:hypothetical protein